MRPAPRRPGRRGPFDRSVGDAPAGEGGMNAWWWAAIGLAAWLGVSPVVGLWLGPIIGHCSRAREAREAQSILRMGAAPDSGI
jgi:hypothetical protein